MQPQQKNTRSMFIILRNRGFLSKGRETSKKNKNDLAAT